MFPGEAIIKRGSWLCGGSVRARLVLVRADVFAGSGDEEDPPEIRDTREVEAFRIWFESPPGSGDFRAGTHQYLSVREAMDDLARLLPSPPEWDPA